MVRFNFDRSVGIFAVGAAAFLLAAMIHADPTRFIQDLINYRGLIFWLYVLSLLVAAVFLSFESSRE